MSTKNKSCYIVAAKRTPLGKYGGDLSSLSAVELGTIAVKGALKQCNLSPENIDECIFGNVLSAGLGQNPARQISIASKIPFSVPCTTINKVCSSGMKAVQFAVDSIKTNKNHIVVCGGTESMSNVPYYIKSNDLRIHSRSKTMGNKTIIDGLIYDGLTDIYSGNHMGNCADACAEKYKISRKEQDEYSIISFKRAQNATKKKLFRDEIIPIEVRVGRKTKIVDKDEGCLKFDEKRMRNLKPAFNRSNGSVTAGNASQLSDGAAALIVCDEESLKKYKLKPLAKILSYADAAKAPEEFTTAPALAIPKALDNAGLKMSDLGKNDYFEINEAFSVVSLANQKLLGIDINNLNVFGGAVSLGHPLGCSGARILVTLINVLKSKKGSRFGIAGICNGGGGASSMFSFNLTLIMARRSNRDEFNQSLKDMQRGDLEDVLNVQQKVVRIALGQSNFTHPNAPKINGQYQPNQTEINFTQNSRSTMTSNFFRFIVKRAIPQKRMLMFSTMGTVLGGTYGLTLGRMAASRDYIRLQDSPLATEARYQLWQINPKHPWLRGFEHEMDQYENYQHRYEDSSYNDEYNDAYDRNNELTVTPDNKYQNRKMRYVQRPNSNQGQPKQQPQRDDDFNAMKSNKRDRFYKGRSGQNSYNESDEVMDFFEQTQHGVDPKNEVDEFFQGDSKQKWG